MPKYTTPVTVTITVETTGNHPSTFTKLIHPTRPDDGSHIALSGKPALQDLFLAMSRSGGRGRIFHTEAVDAPKDGAA